MTSTDLKTRIFAEWYRNGMHDFQRTGTQNGVPPLTKQEMRQSVNGFKTALFQAIDDLVKAENS